MSFIGNRIYGAQFIDLSEKINENLIAAFDAISHFSGSFYYGRYDIKCQSIDEMILNNNFTILEFNGAGSIPNHIYTGHYSIGEAYREIIRHWTILFHISRINNKQGVPYTRFTEGWKYLKKAKKHFRYLKAINIK